MKISKLNCVITKTPYRISLGGGGTDLPFYYKKKGGLLLTAAINQYCYVSLSKRKIDEDILVQTTAVEKAKKIELINQKFIGAALNYFDLIKGIQVSTFTTIPTKTGLGTSSTLMVGLVNAASYLNGFKLSKKKLAEIAYFIERVGLNLSGGFQDQFIASYGSIQKIKINRDSSIKIKQLKLPFKILKKLEKSLILIYSGQQRESSKITKGIKDKKNNLDIMDEIKEIGILSEKYLLSGDIEKLGFLMDRHWEIKKNLSSNISNPNIEKFYKFFKKLGSPGGKIIGAGGGGFFMMAVPSKQESYIKNLIKNNFKILEWKFDLQGSRIIEKM